MRTGKKGKKKKGVESGAEMRAHSQFALVNVCVWHRCVPVQAVECARSTDVVVQLSGTFGGLVGVGLAAAAPGALVSWFWPWLVSAGTAPLFYHGKRACVVSRSCMF